MNYKLKRIRQWMKENKNATIYLAIFVSYTLIMFCVFLIGSADQKGCSSGSLSSIVEEANTTNGSEEPSQE